MKTWMLPWLFPLCLLGAVVFVAAFGRYAALIAVPVGLVLFSLLRFRGDADEGSDSDTQYWRIKRL